MTHNGLTHATRTSRKVLDTTQSALREASRGDGMSAEEIQLDGMRLARQTQDILNSEVEKNIQLQTIVDQYGERVRALEEENDRLHRLVGSRPDNNYADVAEREREYREAQDVQHPGELYMTDADRYRHRVEAVDNTVRPTYKRYADGVKLPAHHDVAIEQRTASQSEAQDIRLASNGDGTFSYVKIEDGKVIGEASTEEAASAAYLASLGGEGSDGKPYTAPVVEAQEDVEQQPPLPGIDDTPVTVPDVVQNVEGMQSDLQFEPVGKVAPSAPLGPDGEPPHDPAGKTMAYRPGNETSRPGRFRGVVKRWEQ